MSFPYEQLQSLQDAPFAVAIAEGSVLFPAIETAHVLAFTLVVGLIARVDLDLIGIGKRHDASASMAREILPLVWIAFGAAVASGGLLFASNAVRYFHNHAFRAKFILLLFAGTNMLVFHAITWRRVAEVGPAATMPRAARGAGALSLILWCAIVVAGRWVGFLNAP